MTDEEARVLVGDEHEAARAGVRAVLEEDGFTVCGEASTASEAVELALAVRPDIALLDVELPGDGIAAARAMSGRAPGTYVVMLTAATEDADLFAALQAGAAGYLLKGTDPARLSHALRGVLKGEAAIPRTLVARLVAEFGGRSRRRVALERGGVELTAREWEVLELLRHGLTTAQAAERLRVSPVTVRRHVSTAVVKLGAADREAAVGMLEVASGLR